INTAARFGQRLPVFARHALANPVKIFFNELPVAEKDARSFHRRRLAPRRKCRRGGFDRFIDNVRAAHRHLGNDFAARRIVNRRSCEAIWFAPFAVDEGGTRNHGKAPSSKLQAPEKLRIPSTKERRELIGDTYSRKVTGALSPHGAG